ncbi:protein of unknown function [Clostridium beijerinckii]|nr:protein of unknown function [Clostridium beijerinckii]
MSRALIPLLASFINNMNAYIDKANITIDNIKYTIISMALNIVVLVGCIKNSSPIYY